ncbi:MAG TPA: hypothetical protein VNO35_09645 [Steroidobacteraceae bacterium]|nr:hypothetical protein [Steroidobacteraceae bacterium]
MIHKCVLTSMAALILASTTGPVLASDDEDHNKVLGSVHVRSGEHADKATTVNGSVDIGANAVVKHAETVNGSITIHDHATVDSVETVNGTIDIGQGAHVAGKVELVNGNMTLDTGADVGGHLSNVNGSIQLTAAHVGGGIETKNSNLTVGANSRVEGGILYDESSEGWFSFFGTPKVPQVIIGPGAIVKGSLRFRREVKLYVSDQATIGPVEGATVIRFSGARP